MMQKKKTIWALTITSILAIEGLAIYILAADDPFVGPFRNDPQAHHLYDQMIAALHQAETLSFSGRNGHHKNRTRNSYRLWMKKPNYFRVETINSQGVDGGTLVGDGNNLWAFWPDERPRMRGENMDSYENSNWRVYRKRATPIGGHSIWHATRWLGANVNTIINPSVFHGYTSSLQPHMDGVRLRGTETVDGHCCDVIEVSFTEGFRKWYLWLSQEDHLPRKLKEVVHGTRRSHTVVGYWENIVINTDIPDSLFTWSPPSGYRRWEPEDPMATVRRSGPVPDFTLSSVEKKKISLSDYHGKLIWLCIWHVGCPPCRHEIPALEKLYRQYQDRDFIVLGFNCANPKEITQRFLEKHDVSFPNIVDGSNQAFKVAYHEFGHTGTVPHNIIIDPEGNIVDAWHGYEEGLPHGRALLHKAGLAIED